MENNDNNLDSPDSNEVGDQFKKIKSSQTEPEDPINDSYVENQNQKKTFLLHLIIQ